jgi:hypothetical protein
MRAIPGVSIGECPQVAPKPADPLSTMLNGPQSLTADAPEPMPVRPVAPPVQLPGLPGSPGSPGQAATPASGPDVEIAVNDAMLRVFAVFQVDPVTHEMHVSVVDEAGRLVRLIPPDSVAQMINEMAAYSRRHSG